jgi:hypothetical protein
MSVSQALISPNPLKRLLSQRKKSGPLDNCIHCLSIIRRYAVAKRKVFVNIALESTNTIDFFSTPELVGQFRKYGTITELGSKDHYQLVVDRQQDFGEIVEKIRNYPTA